MPKKKKEPITSTKGMHDLLPEESPYWERVRSVVFDIAKFYQYGYVATPIVEPAELFERTLGEDTDVVHKEMYTFETKGGDRLALRPEGTAPIARAHVEHGWNSLPQPVRIFYYGPMFRHERPQRGRFRQFHQFGFELFGIEEPLADALLVQIAYAILKDLRVKNVVVEVNTMGERDCREKYRKELKNYFKPHVKKMCGDCKRRYKKNPLRMLDCKQETCQEYIARAPQIIDHVCDDCKEHFKKFLEFLDEIEIPYMLNPYLVRGLDYYTRTVFEIFTEEEAKDKRNALISGGRYDELLKVVGGKESPAVGFAGGIERIVAELKEGPARVGITKQPQVFLVQLGERAQKRSLALLEEFRKARIPVYEALGKHSIRSQMKIADKLDVGLSVIFGQKEALAHEAIIRDMASGVQETVPLAKLMGEIKKRLKKL